jgi:3-oxoacyl-[acyl-carrier-protein] synthase III
MITGTGSAIPEKVVTNSDLEKIVDTTDEWIRTRTGIETRYWAAESQFTSDLCTEAGKKAIAEAGITPEQIDLIIVATITPDMGFPSTACFVQKKLKAVNAAALDISAACAGFIYGLDIADSYIRTGKAKTILVIGGETLSRITDFTDRNTCVLFGDGAGAVVVQPSDGVRGILGTYIKSDGRLHELLYLPGLGTAHPPTHQSVDEKMHFIKMAGREVFKYAVIAMGDAAEHIVKATGLDPQHIDLLIPHQANMRIIDATARRVGLSQDKVYVNVNKFGNTSAASIPIALDEARKTGRLKPGGTVVLVAFGAGFTWGSAAIKF